MEKAQTLPSIIDINVGGHVYTTSLASLTRYPDSMLGVMFSGRRPLLRIPGDVSLSIVMDQCFGTS